MKVCKYTQLEYIKSSIENGIFASHLERVNDPYEMEGIVNPDDYRICCVSKSTRQMLLWSYYTNHRGCTIQFDVPDDAFVQVNYIDDFKTRRYSNSDEIKNMLMEKGKEWEHENEYRAVFYANDPDNSMWKKVKNEIFYKAPVTKITFGVLAEKNDAYIDAIEYLSKYNKGTKNKIEVAKLILRTDRYELIPDPQYKYEDALKKRKK